jgi:hypothetical protein
MHQKHPPAKIAVAVGLVAVGVEAVGVEGVGVEAVGVEAVGAVVEVGIGESARLLLGLQPRVNSPIAKQNNKAKTLGSCGITGRTDINKSLDRSKLTKQINPYDNLLP